MAPHHPLLFVFVDGIGLAPAADHNPLSCVRMPTLERLIGGPLVLESTTRRSDLLLEALDAGLGVDGLPQSATGQTALLTGHNGALILGRHQPAIPGAQLRALLERESLFLKLRQAGYSATFANAYSDEYLERLESGRGRASVTTLAVGAAGFPFRRLTELEAGAAVTWDIERDLFARREPEVEPVTSQEAGRHLAAVAREHDFTLFETFLTDLAGHRRWGVEPEEALRRLDGLIAGVEAAAPPELTWLLTSDHGNVEDARTTSHTRNPVPLLVRGPMAQRFRGLESILEVAPAIRKALASTHERVPS